MSKTPFIVSLLALVPALAVLGEPNVAHACGGLFCSTTPVDQNAERIIFTINGDHTVTAYVQISYTGAPDQFAWIIPAPTAPELSADFPDLAMRALDTATAPRYFKQTCGRGPFGGTGGSGGTGGVSAGPGVTVIARQNVGPFETVTLEGTSATVLVEWLQNNGYRITDKMTPFIQPYVEGGMKFVAMRLLPGKETKDITPLVMTYDSDKPAIPLRLTTVAAQPEMGIVTFILADKRWAPDNYVDLKIADRLIEFDQFGFQNNYLSVVSREADKVGGQAFVTEYARATLELAQQVQNQFLPSWQPDVAPARDALLALLRRFPYVTRLYTRMSAEEMTEDPTFKVASDQGDVSNVHDLTDPNFDFSRCPPVTPPAPNPCTFTYCGRQGACAPVFLDNGGAVNPVASCVCSRTASARVTPTGGTPQVYCEPLAMDLDSAPASGTTSAPLLSSACEGVSCGEHGRCVPINGSPTCKCDAGYGAVAQQTFDPNTGSSRTSLTCQLVWPFVPSMPALPPIGGGAGGTTGIGGSGGSGTRCNAAPAQETSTLSFAWLLAGLGASAGFLVRRRRRR
jgi:hypothetical protein